MIQASQGFQSNRTIMLSMMIGAVGILILGIQPLLLGALLNAGKINAVELGWIATVEVLGMALGVWIGARLMAGSQGKRIAVAACLLMALANAITPSADTVMTIAWARSLAGLAEGAMIAVSILTISHGAAPARLNAIYLTAGATPQLVFAYLLPVKVFPVYGVESGFYILAGVGLLSAALAVVIRDRLAPEPEEAGGRVAWTPKVVLALAATLVTASAIGACWSYAEPMGARQGLTTASVGVAITISLAFQIIGSLVVALVGYRLPFRLVLPGGVIVQAAAVMTLIAIPGIVGFSFGLAVFGFCWQACLPFAMDLVIEADASRMTAPLVMPLTLAGLSMGPLIASALVGASVIGAFVFGIAAFVTAAGLYLFIFRPGSAPPVRLASLDG
ncbi:MFS transporter [Sphingobium sp. TB-6]|uniref:MFS transporter n=1 Tax=Sphingobium sp. TB-6 TaxID=2728850 RepID=UPI00146E1FA9|nr:MFS transporter [Sphingobium sp. TB-6]NML90668.1 MFS transporter [Sphingobium sp. TB-6]